MRTTKQCSALPTYMELPSLSSPPHSLIQRTADYRRFHSLPVASPLPSPHRVRAIRLKRRPKLLPVESAKAMTQKDSETSPYGDQEMLALMRQLALDNAQRQYHIIPKKLRLASLEVPQGSLTRLPISPLPKRRLEEHPLLSPGETSPLGSKKSLWSQHSAFPPPVQTGSAVTYAIGHKNWFRDNDLKIRVARLKRDLTRK